jgi:hypothetical protein
MRIAYWIPTATATHSEYVILVSFKRQQLLHERAIMLCYMQCLPCYEQKHKNRCASGDIGVRFLVREIFSFKFDIFHPELFTEYIGQNVSVKQQ